MISYTDHCSVLSLGFEFHCEGYHIGSLLLKTCRVNLNPFNAIKQYETRHIVFLPQCQRRRGGIDALAQPDEWSTRRLLRSPCLSHLGPPAGDLSFVKTEIWQI